MNQSGSTYQAGIASLKPVNHKVSGMNMLNNIRLFNEYKDYINSLFQHCSRLLAVRVDLEYTENVAKQISIQAAKHDLAHLLNNRRSKPSLFQHLMGYVWALDYTPVKGPHFHCIFFLDGSKVQKDVHWGFELGRYWNEVITSGRGLFHNCNARIDGYHRIGVGMISHFDTEMRDCLEEDVLSYLFKAEQIPPPKMMNSGRRYGRGEMPVRQSNAGRPRLYEHSH